MKAFYQKESFSYPALPQAYGAFCLNGFQLFASMTYRRRTYPPESDNAHAFKKGLEQKNLFLWFFAHAIGPFLLLFVVMPFLLRLAEKDGSEIYANGDLIFFSFLLLIAVGVELFELEELFRLRPAELEEQDTKTSRIVVRKKKKERFRNELKTWAWLLIAIGVIMAIYFGGIIQFRDDTAATHLAEKHSKSSGKLVASRPGEADTLAPSGKVPADAKMSAAPNNATDPKIFQVSSERKPGKKGSPALFLGVPRPTALSYFNVTFTVLTMTACACALLRTHNLLRSELL